MSVAGLGAALLPKQWVGQRVRLSEQNTSFYLSTKPRMHMSAGWTREQPSAHTASTTGGPHLAQSLNSRTAHDCVHHVIAPPPPPPALLPRACCAGSGFPPHDSSARTASSAARSSPSDSFPEVLDRRES